MANHGTELRPAKIVPRKRHQPYLKIDKPRLLRSVRIYANIEPDVASFVRRRVGRRSISDYVRDLILEDIAKSNSKE